MRTLLSHVTFGNLRQLRRYFNVAIVDRQGLIVVSKTDPFIGHCNLIVVPASILPGLLTAVHLRFQHGNKSHLTQLFNRHLFAIRSAPAIQHVVDNWEQCNSVKKIPHELISQSSTPSASKPGEIFCADMLRRTRQHILVTRDVHSSSSIATVVQDKASSSVRYGLLISSSSCSIRTASCTVRVDNAPGFSHLKEDPTFKKHGNSLD